MVGGIDEVISKAKELGAQATTKDTKKEEESQVDASGYTPPVKLGAAANLSMEQVMAEIKKDLSSKVKDVDSLFKPVPLSALNAAFGGAVSVRAFDELDDELKKFVTNN